MGTGKTHKDRFPNPNTRPDLNDPLIRRTRADAIDLFGVDVLADEVDFHEWLEALRVRHCSPEFQAVAEAGREETRLHEDRQLVLLQRRRCEKLSPYHVDAIRIGCDASLNPLTTTEIMRAVIADWDGAQNMFLLGATGNGKTYTATWCAMRAILRGDDAESTTAIRICEASPERLAVLRSVHTLVIDQLHTLRSPAGKDMPAWQVGPVVDLIDFRYEQRLTTIAAGTIKADDMTDLLGKDVRRRFTVRLSSQSDEIIYPTSGGTK